jgi:hypothetical protein
MGWRKSALRAQVYRRCIPERSSWSRFPENQTATWFAAHHWQTETGIFYCQNVPGKAAAVRVHRVVGFAYFHLNGSRYAFLRRHIRPFRTAPPAVLVREPCSSRRKPGGRAWTPAAARESRPLTLGISHYTRLAFAITGSF